MASKVILRVMPGTIMTREEFAKFAPPRSIALDGFLDCGPYFDLGLMHQNFDHHDGVYRPATMSTAMQVMFAIKGGMMDFFTAGGTKDIHVFINDPDQDTALATYLIQNYERFDGVQSIAVLSRLLNWCDELDITAGAFPRRLNDQLVRQHVWVFSPYNSIRKSGALANAIFRKDESVLRNCIEAVHTRIGALIMGKAEEQELDTRHEILYDGEVFKVVNEVGGTDARTYLFSRGMKAYVSIVAERSDGRRVVSVGRVSEYITRFPVQKIVAAYNKLEGLEDSPHKWGGTTLISASSRMNGTGLSIEQLRDTALDIVKAS